MVDWLLLGENKTMKNKMKKIKEWFAKKKPEKEISKKDSPPFSQKSILGISGFLVKTKNYLNAKGLIVKNFIFRPVRWGIRVHNKVIQVTENDLRTTNDRNPYHLLLDWCIDIIIRGVIITTIITLIMGWGGLGTTIRLVLWTGLLFWIVLHAITEMRKAVRGE